MRAWPLASCSALTVGLRCSSASELGDQREERQHELVERGYGGMREDHRLDGVEPAREVVDDHVADVVGDVLGGIAVGDDLVVRDDDVGLDAHVLQAHAVDERAEVVAQMQAARRAVAREHGVLLRVDGQIGMDLVAALERDLVASLVGHGISKRRMFNLSIVPERRML